MNLRCFRRNKKSLFTCLWDDECRKIGLSFRQLMLRCSMISLWEPHSELDHIMLSLLCQYNLKSIKAFLFSSNIQVYFQYPLFSPHLLRLTVSTHNHYIGQVSKYWFSLCRVNRRQSWRLWYSLHFLRANMIWNDIIYLWLSYIFLSVYFHRLFVHVKTAKLVYRKLFSRYRVTLYIWIISVYI